VPSSLIPSRRIRVGSDSPCTTSVTKITANVRNRIRSRSGNGAPLLTVSGVQIVLGAQRDALVELRRQGEISNETMNRVIQELDLEESRLEI
jgi:hypothetical protein